LLDCTLRDGSYLIDYHFTAEDTYIIASALSAAGIERIEVGHGLGLDAQTKGKGRAANSDTEYIESAVAAAKGASKIGAFFIPGIGQTDSIRRAADAGLNFIRVGTNIDELDQAAEALRIAKSLGLETWSNLMKSYVLPPSEFAERCAMAENFGADVVALVDSAGGMTPDEVQDYARAARVRVRIPIGFHGHNNLQLAVANCLAGAAAGISFFDASLRGMGRSAGNAPLEVLASLFAREGFDAGRVDWQRLIALADRLVAPMMPRDTGLLPIELASGLAYFHSSFQKIIDESSSRNSVPSYATILKIGKSGRNGITPEMAETAAKNASGEFHEPEALSDSKWVNRQVCATLQELSDTLGVLAAKTGFSPVLSIARPRRKNAQEMRIAPIRVGHGLCVGHVESPDQQTDQAILREIGACSSWWILDLPVSQLAKPGPSTRVLRYDDRLLVLLALLDFARVHEVTTAVLPERAGANQTLFGPIMRQSIKDVLSGADCAIAMDVFSALSIIDIEKVKEGGILLVAEMDSVDGATIATARKRGLKIYRLDFTNALLSEASRLVNSCNRSAFHSGSFQTNGITIVAGGTIGPRGSYVVDSISAPSTILGQSDGLGGITAADTHSAEYRTAREWLLSKIRK